MELTQPDQLARQLQIHPAIEGCLICFATQETMEGKIKPEKNFQCDKPSALLLRPIDETRAGKLCKAVKRKENYSERR